MPLSSKVGAFGAGALLVAGVTAVAGGFMHDNSHAAGPKIGPAATGTSHTVSSTDPARSVYDDAKDSVAYISSTMSQGQATGSGFVVSSDGKIITNEHVVDGAQQVTVKLGVNGKEQPAQVLAADASKDLALLKIDTGGKSLHPLAFADSSKLSVGDTAYAIGNPYGLDHTFTRGIVSALDREIQAPDGTPIKGAIQTDAAINPGNSGGALLDSDGDVIGVNSQIVNTGASQGSEAGNVGIGFAIPSDTVKDFIAHPTSSQQGQSQEQQQADPYGQQQQEDPYGEQQQQEDPYGEQQQQEDPYGQQQESPDGSGGGYSIQPSPDGGLQLVPQG